MIRQQSEPSDRFICCPEAPWTPDRGRACHPQAKLISAGDYYDTYRCPICNHVFDVELPE